MNLSVEPILQQEANQPQISTPISTSSTKTKARTIFAVRRVILPLHIHVLERKKANYLYRHTALHSFHCWNNQIRRRYASQYADYCKHQREQKDWSTTTISNTPSYFSVLYLDDLCSNCCILLRPYRYVDYSLHLSTGFLLWDFRNISQ